MFDASLIKAKRSLAAVVREERAVRSFTVTDAVDLALDVCDLLGSLHAEGIAHGDLGPHSVRLAWPRIEGRLRAIEIFSLARESDEDDPSLSGAVIALQSAFTPSQKAPAPSQPRTSPFLAPEQRPGSMIDPRADIWSLGALLRWMLRLDTKTATAPRGTPSPVLLNVIEQCLQMNPNDRPQTIDELAEKIASFASEPPVRFERLANRRQQAAEAKKALGRREKLDGLTALERLDANAMHREREALSQPPACDEKSGWSAAAPARLLDTLDRVAPGVLKEPLHRPKAPSADEMEVEAADIFEMDDDEPETRVAISPDEDPLARPLPHSELLAAVSQGAEPPPSNRATYSSISPVSVSIEATPLPAPVPTAPMPRVAPIVSARAQLKTDPDQHAIKKRGRTILAFAAAAFATVAIGAAVGVGTSLLSAQPEKATAATPPPAATPLPPAKTEPSVITPASLPEAKEQIPTMTPNALPNAPAPRVHKKRVAPSGTAAPTESGDMLEDALGQ